MLRRVHLHGSLEKLHDGPIEVMADTVADAIKIVSSQLPAFRPNAITGYRRVQVAGCDRAEHLFAPSDMVDIHILPQLTGGKSGGFVQILIGTALVAASFLLPGSFAVLSGILLKVGALMILGGVLQMVRVPSRDSPQSAATNRSHYLGVPENTVAIGTRIPILYGRRKVGGQLLSAILATNESFATVGSGSGGGAGG